MQTQPKVAYVSMEVGVHSDKPTYAGGLGILAGDTLRSAADLGMPVIGISLLYRSGYFTQRLCGGRQHEEYPPYDPAGEMQELPQQVSVPIGNSHVAVRAWLHHIKGCRGTVPVLFLDTHKINKEPLDEGLTGVLYGGDKRYRFAQELVLGIGGVRILHALGMSPDTYHLNEGHGAFATLELQKLFGASAHERTVFTTHTPEPAGHDVFGYDLVQALLNGHWTPDLPVIAGAERLNTTLLALNRSRYVNAVSQKHAHVSAHMFPGSHFHAITNGVHSYTWTSPPFQALYDAQLPRWRAHPKELAHAHSIPLEDILTAHHEAKTNLIEHVRAKTGVSLKQDVFTIGFARRFAEYKRALLLFRDIARLKGLGPLQIVIAGKAHPQDDIGKEILHQVYRTINAVAPEITAVILPNYSMVDGAVLTAGSDLWLNTPRVPREACGTSGMKAFHNGVPNLSTADGWWRETQGGGWTFGSTEPTDPGTQDAEDAHQLYQALDMITHLFRTNPLAYAGVMRQAITQAAYFNTHRMVEEYAVQAWKLHATALQPA